VTHRIAFAGASGTGKTTLARWVSDAFGYPMNPIGARSVAAELGFTNPYDVDQASQDAYTQAVASGITDPAEAARLALAQPFTGTSCRPMFQRKVQVSKIAWEERASFVTDRTPFDDLVYASMHCREVVDEAFIERAIQATSRYTMIFFCPMVAFYDPAGDPSRLTDVAYHRQFEASVRGWLALSGWSEGAPGRPLRTLHHGSLAERQRMIRWVL
jgi:hypothetical protein